MEDQKKEEGLLDKQQTSARDNAAAGMSTGAGATAGVIAGSFVAEKSSAAENVEVDETVESAAAEPTGKGVTHHHNTATQVQPSEAAQEQSPEAAPPVPAETNASSGAQAPDQDVHVVAFETVDDGQGGQMDVAVLSVEGQEYILADVDQNGEADVLASDLNNNGQLEYNEMADVSGEHIDMAPFRDTSAAGNDYGELADNSGSDYINDADVDAYMA